MKKLLYTIIGLGVIVGLGLAVFFLFQSTPKLVGQTSGETVNIFDKATKYKNVFVHTIERQEYDTRLQLHVSYPVTDNEKINQAVKTMTEEYIVEYENRAEEIKTLMAKNPDKELPPSFHGTFLQHFDVSFANDDYVAFLFERSTNTGNTGEDVVFTKLFSRSTGAEISLAQLFTTPAYLERLSKLSREILLKKMEPELNEISDPALREEQSKIQKEMITRGTEPKPENFNSYIFTATGTLQIIFDKYQVTPGYVGTVTIDIPIEAVSDILVPELRKILDIEKTLPSLIEDNQKEIIGETENNARPPIVFSTSTDTVDCRVMKCIALTFDDGPSVFTSKLLDVLAENKIKATFFVLGQSANIQRDTIARIAKDGHVIGNHTWNHKDLRQLSAKDILSQINRTNEVVSEIADVTPKLTRPPYGAINELVTSVVQNPIILWSIDPNDWKDRDTKIVADRIIAAAKPRAIILSHDIYETTVDAMPRVIKTLTEEGYHFVTVPDLFPNNSLKPGVVYRHL